MSKGREAPSLFAHTLKTPLATIKVAAELLYKHLNEEISAKDQQLLDTLRRNVNTLELRVDKLVNLVLSGDADAEKVSVDLTCDQLEVLHSIKAEAQAGKSAGEESREAVSAEIGKMASIEEMTAAAGKIDGGDQKIVIHADPEIADLIPKFLENRARDTAVIIQALDKDDYDTIRILAHSMKGAGGGFGFVRITEIGRSLEDAAKERDSQKIREGVSDLSLYLERLEVIYD